MRQVILNMRLNILYSLTGTEIFKLSVNILCANGIKLSISSKWKVKYAHNNLYSLPPKKLNYSIENLKLKKHTNLIGTLFWHYEYLVVFAKSLQYLQNSQSPKE